MIFQPLEKRVHGTMRIARKFLLMGRVARGGSAVAVLMCILFGILGFTAGWLMAQRYAQEDTAKRCASGPWGHLRYTDTFVEVPKERVKVESVPQEPTRWFVAAVSPLNLKLALCSCGLAEQQVKELLDSSVAVTNNAVGYELRPADEFVRDLRPGERANLYKFLATFPQNVAQAEPYRFDASLRMDWLGATQLDPEVVRLVDKLIYRQNGLWLFSDLNLVLRHYPDPQGYADLFRALSRVPSLVAYLRVELNDDADDLAKYWGWPDRMEAIWTRVKASQATGGIQHISLSALLPPFAREHLYRHRMKEDPEIANCHYSAMNFWSDPPDLRFTNDVEVVRSLREDYVEVTGGFQLGDVVQFMEKGNRVVHSCNYIADRLVFTKNSRSVISPWILATLDDLQELYSYPKPVTMRVLRRHDLIKH